MLEALEKVMLESRPDKVLIYGDTNSTLAGALAAAKLHIPVAHVEAGLRSFNRQVPEEINRVIVDHLSTWLFAPTSAAVANLHREGIADPAIHFVGDVMYDAALYFGRKVRAQILDKHDLEPNHYVLATIHRAENTDVQGTLAGLFGALSALAEQIPVVVPLHPRTRAALLRNNLLDGLGGKLRLIEPVGYLDMLTLEKNAALIATDSGGVQKEAFFHRVPCVTLRHETEWVELVELGWNLLLPPTSAAEIQTGLLRCLAQQSRPRVPGNLYGGGQAGERITQLLRAA